MRITVDPERCTGHGRCYSLVPELFEPDDAGRSVVVGEIVGPKSEARARLAAENCPEQAISVTE